MAHDRDTDSNSLSSISVHQEDDRWIVRILENGERHERSFSTEEHANSYAAGQRKRLQAESSGGS
jgi:hypothetical protein